MSKQKAYINATIINGDKNVPVIEKGTIIVDEFGMISQTGNSSDVSIPEGYEVIDLQGKYIMPGLINAHLHIFYDGAPRKDMMGEEMQAYNKMLHTPEGEKMLREISIDCVNTLVNSGVTTIRDVGSLYGHDLLIRSEVKAGTRVAPRVVASGSIIIPTAGHGGSFPCMLFADGPWEFRKAVRKNFETGVDWIKICSTGGVADARSIGESGMPHITQIEMEALCDEAHRRNLMVATHCQSTFGMREALAAGVDSIEHGGIIEDDMVDMFLHNPKAKRGYTALCPTIAACRALNAAQSLFTQNKENEIVFANAKITGKNCEEGLRKAVASGIKVCIGTDAAVPYVTQYNTYKELIYFQEVCDMPAIEVIERATKDTADVIGVLKDTGTLDVGKSADFIVLESNPLDDLYALKQPYHVVAMGNLIEKPEIKRIPEVEDLNF